MSPRPAPKPEPRKKKAAKRLGPSDKRQAQGKVYRELLRPAYLAGVAHGQRRQVGEALCVRCRSNLATEVHHRAGREGEDLLDTRLWAALCRSCHTWVHAYPGDAYREGWLVSRNASAGEFLEDGHDAAPEPGAPSTAEDQ